MKPIFVIVWIAFGLVAMAHCPLDALGDFSESLSCMAGVAATGHSGESVKSDDSHGELACRVINRTKSIAPVAMAKFDCSRLTRWPTIPAIKQKELGGELGFLLSNWQFLRRTALAPRAPSSLV
ncbi:MAG: hypothetical protein NTW21_04425 [Verrucomicrobia bacterium]|nr:hypothetical protein [Verrucomicrobiota bacterium]